MVASDVHERPPFSESDHNLDVPRVRFRCRSREHAMGRPYRDQIVDRARRHRTGLSASLSEMIQGILREQPSRLWCHHLKCLNVGHHRHRPERVARADGLGARHMPNYLVR